MSIITSELEKLKIGLVRMSLMVKRVVHVTQELFNAEAFESREKLWGELEDLVIILDEMRKDLVNEVLMFIAKTQPLGRELLAAHVILSTAYDVHRISRYCREIARIDSMLAPSSGLNRLVSLSDMFKLAVEAVEAALDDIFEFAPKRSVLISSIDFQVDEAYKKILTMLASFINVPREVAFEALVMRHIERIVDHAQYIEQHLSGVVA